MKIIFDWDTNNCKHLFEENSDRELTLNEIESIFFDSNKYINESTLNAFYEEKRFRCIGKSNKNRLLIVIFTIREMKIRPITAWPTSKNKYIQLYESDR